MPVNSPVAVVGFPTFTNKGVFATRTTTNGVISAHDFTALVDNLPYSNYYVSAKIDTGNSGGIAFSKNNNALCLLGIPTWLSVGNYETQGVIQNIHNIMSN